MTEHATSTAPADVFEAVLQEINTHASNIHNAEGLASRILAVTATTQRDIIQRQAAEIERLSHATGQVDRTEQDADVGELVASAAINVKNFRDMAPVVADHPLFKIFELQINQAASALGYGAVIE